MAQFIEGLDRQQSMLMTEHLNGYIDENSPLRAIDAFADILDYRFFNSTQSTLLQICPANIWGWCYRYISMATLTKFNHRTGWNMSVAAVST